MTAAVIPIYSTVSPPPPAPAASLQWAERYAAAGLPPIVVRPGGKEPIAVGWQTITLGEARALIESNPGANVGIAVPPGYVVLDVDQKGGIDGYATLTAFELEHGPLPPTLSAKTPSGGAHYWFRVPEGVTVPNSVKFAHGLDTRSGGKGLVVAEPSVGGGGPYRWENWGAPIAPIPEWLLHAMRAKKHAATPPAPGELIRIPQGQRNAVLFERASTLRAAGLSGSAIYAAIAAINHESCVPPLGDAEVHTIAESASKYARGPVPHEVFGGASPLPPGALAHKTMESEWALVPLKADWGAFEPLPHFVARWIPQGEVTLLAGHGGGGKSYVALSIAVHVALGRSFGPLETRRAKVLLYSCEDDAKVLQSRLVRICRSLGVALSDLDGALTLLDASDTEPALFRKDALPAMERLRCVVAEHGADLIVIDNASDAFDGDEIKRAEVRAFIRSLRARLARPNRAVLLLAHINKMTARSGKSEASEDYSGSTAWHNSVRSRLSLRSGMHDSLTIEHAKANHGPKADPVQLQWKDGVPVVGASVPLDHAGYIERREQRRQCIVGIIRTIEGRGGRVPTARTGPGSTFKVLSADAAFPSDVDSKALVHFLDELQDVGLIFRKVVRTESYKNVEVFSCSPP